MNICISGSRDATDDHVDAIGDKLDSVIGGQKNIKINVGDCRGVDTIVVQYCKKNNISYEVHKADWNSYGKAAGPMRNQQMINKSDMLIAFPLGESKGTRGTIKMATKKGIKVHVDELN